MNHIYKKLYKKIAITTFTVSVISEMYQYHYTNFDNVLTCNNYKLFIFNVIFKSIARGLIWPWHVPLNSYLIINDNYKPIYKRKGNVFSDEYYE